MFWFYTTMTGMVSNSVNFGSRPLHPINLRRKNGEFIPAIISELGSREDILELKTISKEWPNADYVQQIADTARENADSSQKTYAIEFPGFKKLSQRIVGLAKSDYINILGDESLRLTFLQTKPEYMHNFSLARDLSGIGEALLGQTFAFARDLNAKTVHFFAEDYGFYDESFRKADINAEKSGDFGERCDIAFENFSKYIEYINKKYRANF